MVKFTIEGMGPWHDSLANSFSVLKPLVPSHLLSLTLIISPCLASNSLKLYATSEASPRVLISGLIDSFHILRKVLPLGTFSMSCDGKERIGLADVTGEYRRRLNYSHLLELLPPKGFL